MNKLSQLFGALMCLFLVAENTTNAQTTRKLLLEEFTGTWCGLCPQGLVFMDSIINNYDNVIGVAIHQGDPMTFPAGDDVGSEYTGGGVPAFLVDRYLFDDYNFVSIGADYDLLSEKVEERLNMQSNVGVSILNVDFDETNNTAAIQVNAHFYEAISGQDLRFNLYVVEDNVQSDEQGYNQSNFFTGYEDHAFASYPPSIANFNHRHVLRDMAGGAWGVENSIDNSNITAGDNFQFTFEIALNETWQKENLSFIALVQQYSPDETNRQVLNIEEISFETATQTADENIISTNVNNAISSNKNVELLSVYPVPLTENTKIELNLAKTQKVKIYVVDERFRTVAHLRNEFINKGMHTIDWHTKNSLLNSGIYFIVVEADGVFSSYKVTKAK